MSLILLSGWNSLYFKSKSIKFFCIKISFFDNDLDLIEKTESYYSIIFKLIS